MVPPKAQRNHTTMHPNVRWTVTSNPHLNDINIFQCGLESSKFKLKGQCALKINLATESTHIEFYQKTTVGSPL